jgi:hypothetical protein
VLETEGLESCDPSTNLYVTDMECSSSKAKILLDYQLSMDREGGSQVEREREETVRNLDFLEEVITDYTDLVTL